MDAFFGYGFLGLGNFKAVVFDHKEQEQITLGIEVDGIAYSVTLSPSSGEFHLQALGRFPKIEPLSLSLPVAFPYPANASAEQRWGEFKVVWNGFLAQVEPSNITPETTTQAQQLAQRLHEPLELLRTTDIAQLRRGFTKPTYAAVVLSPWLVSEEEVATLLANDKYLFDRVATYLEGIVHLDLRYHVQLGTAVFSLDVLDRETGVSCELVNEGFGVNQLVFLLAKALRSDVRIVAIEEPEIHLHPSAQRKLAQALVSITHGENKRFIITTHSESFLVALLAEVARGNLKPNEIACYLAVKDGREARFERQRVNERGQIEGGLQTFMEGELENLKVFFGLE